MSTRPIVLSAAYGMGNIGDEAICDVLIGDILALQPEARIAVLAWNPGVWRKAHPAYRNDPRVRAYRSFFVPSQWKSPLALASMLRTIAVIARCRLFVWGGGGIIRDRRYWLRGYLSNLRVALLFRRRVVVLTVGADRIADPVVRGMLQVLKKAESIVVRDDESAKNLAEVFADPSVRIGTVRDPVFHYPLAESAKAAHAVVALNLCHKDGANAVDDEFRAFAGRLAEVLKALHAAAPIVLKGVPTDPRDARFIAYVWSLVPSIPFSMVWSDTPEAYVSAVRDASLLIGMRMHGIILGSRVRGLPIVSFRYSAKTEELFASSGNTSHLFPFESFDVPAATDTCLSLLKEGEASSPFASFEADSRKIRDVFEPFLKP